MNKNTVVENNVVCAKAIVDYKNEIEYQKAWLKQIEEALKEKEAKEGVVTWDDVREAFGYGRS